MMKLPKAVENAVCFAQWCVNEQLTDKIREVGMLRVLVNRRADTWCRQNNQEMDWDAAERKIENIDKQIEKLVVEIGLTDFDWPGLYPTFKTPAKRGETMLPEID